MCFFCFVLFKKINNLVYVFGLDLSEALDDDADPTQSAISAVASLAAAWPQLHQGE